MAKSFIILLLTCCFILSTASAHAQTTDDEQSRQITIDEQKVADDLAGAKQLLKLLPLERQSTDKLKESFLSYGESETYLGLKKFQFGEREGYTDINICLITYHGRLAHYELGIYGNPKSWPYLKDQLFAELQGEFADFSQKENSLVMSGTNSELVNRYQQAFADKFGAMEPVEIPAAFQATYETLISPFSEIEINSDIDARKEYVRDFLAKTAEITMDQRLQILNNILKGYNFRGSHFAFTILAEMAEDDTESRSKIIEILKNFHEANSN